MNREARFFAKTMQNGKVIYSALVLCFILLITVSLNIFPMVIEDFFPLTDVNSTLIKTALALGLALLSLYSISALSLGSKRYFLKCCNGENKKLMNLFHFFRPSEFIKTVRFSACCFAVKFIFFAVSMLPSGLMLWLWVRMIMNDASLRVVLAFFCCLLVMLAFGLYFLFRAKRLLFLCGYLFVLDESRKFFECMKISMEKMEHETRRLFLMRFSFIGWFLSCVFVLPIAYVWGYYEQTMAVIASNLILEEPLKNS